MLALPTVAVVLHQSLLVPAGGRLGVDLFFLPCGLLIPTLLLEEYGQRGRVEIAALSVACGR